MENSDEILETICAKNWNHHPKNIT